MKHEGDRTIGTDGGELAFARGSLGGDVGGDVSAAAFERRSARVSGEVFEDLRVELES